ncbi:MAG TPA: tetratricopeptide repeat protein [Pyrinomonadaceae bacterium]|jgi:tetratricopeptide (TPR) repeat protein
METKTLTKTLEPVRVNGDVAQRCGVAKKLMSAGNYEAAREALGELWGGVGNSPEIEGLPPTEQAEVLLRAGALSGWLGSSSQVPGAQGFAKDLISESIRAFETLGDQEKIAEAQSDLALCYWREGAMDEARVWFREAIVKAVDPANRVRILARSTTVEYSTNRFSDALALLDQAAPLLDQIDDDPAHGCYHMQRAAVLQKMGGTENLDRALIENTAASIHFERANHQRYFARVENNIGQILRRLGRYDDSLNHLERARRTFTELGDIGTAAQVNDTRARVFLDQERYIDAEKLAFLSASALEAGDEQSLLAEALETQAVAQARMGRYPSALGTLKRAAHIAETAGDVARSGRVFLTILEELKSFLSPSEIGSMYQEADRRLGDQLSTESMTRLRSCARLATANTATGKTENRVMRGSFEQEVHNRESELIKAALDEASGSVTRAARMLGLTHQGLCYIINHRHTQLLGARAPIRIRRKSIIKKR